LESINEQPTLPDMIKITKLFPQGYKKAFTLSYYDGHSWSR